MTADWVSARVHQPKPEEIVRGALQPQAQALHYIQRCRYPASGGFEAYTRTFQNALEVRAGYELMELDLRRRQAVFANGEAVTYGTLISSIPLPVLVTAIKDAPAPVRHAAGQLQWTSIILVNVGVRRADLSTAHWLYFYDEDIIFSRVSFPHRLAAANVPEGCGSIQAEIYHSRTRPLPAINVLERTMEDLHRVGLLHREDEILLVRVQQIPFGNVIFDHARERAVAVLHEFLREHDIHPCGRYGEWGYLWTDQAVLSGKRVAERLGRQDSRAGAQAAGAHQGV